MTAPRILLAVTDPISTQLIGGQLADLRARGAAPYFLSSPGAASERLCADEGATFVPVAMARAPSPRADAAALVALVAALRRVRPHLVNAGTPKAAMLVGAAAAIARVPCRIHTLHGLRFVTMTGVRGELVRRSQQLACATAHTTVCVSASLRARAIEHGLGAASRLVVLGDGSANGVDLGWLTRTAATDAASAAARAALGIPVTATVLGFVGRVAADKGVAELAAAWAAVRGPDRYLMIVGGPDDTDPVPADVLAALAADPQVRLTGARRDLPAVFGAMDLLVLPTRREGFGNVLVEAAAMGVPVVASRTDGCVDAVADGVTGALVPVGDGAALVAALRRYLDDPSRRRAHGAAGRARVEARFDHRLVLGHLAGLYRTMLAARRLPELR